MSGYDGEMMALEFDAEDSKCKTTYWADHLSDISMKITNCKPSTLSYYLGLLHEINLRYLQERNNGM